MAGTITDTYISMTNEANIAGYSYTAVAALLLYEYVITLGEESRVIWRDFRAGYATLFMINRFNMICMFIAAVGETIPLHNIVGYCLSFKYLNSGVDWYTRSCKATLIFALVVDLNIYLTWAAVSTLRMYAISSCNVYLAIVTGVLAFAPVVTNIAGNTKNAFYISQVDAPDGCYAVPGLSPQIDLT
ncbi:hypothetical protein FOMPIDRAFT_82755 [Fomitopsis schrenkii]|uniref:DUF6533 domain-containing protein n=1 Tax=Fomitopsis schrenkii TaxID=2126942 RepID=S8EI21_FOMSC|nr:hypothetical protein FOMPIDRAFT_82755 [Fomitopsis schrenkii]